MSTSSPNPNNMMLLAVIGIGAYWLFSRQAMAARPTAARPGTAAQNPTAQNVNAGANLLNAGARLLGGLFGTGAPASASAAARIPNDDTAGQPGYGWQYFTNGTAISPTGTYYYQGEQVWSPDGSVFNPAGNISAWDAEYKAMIGL